MQYNPYQYQQRATAHIIDNPNACLFLGMGLGKSVITLTAIQQLIQAGEIKSALVIAPKQVAETTWMAERDKWDHLHGLTMSLACGSAKKREAAVTSGADVVVIGRDNTAWLVNYFKGVLPWDMLVLDELTSFKNFSCQRFKALKLGGKNVKRVVGLTGTPTPKGLINLWAEMLVVDRGKRLGTNYFRFRRDYFHVVEWQGRPIRITPLKGTLEKLTKLLSDICLTMRAEEYLELPPLSVIDTPVALEPKALRAYYDFWSTSVYAATATQDITASTAATLMGKLVQYTNGAMYNGDIDNTYTVTSTAKLEALGELIEQAHEPVLVFYQFRHDAERITNSLKDKEVRVFKDKKDLEAWNRGEIDVLLAHPASTCYGLNMQQGGAIIIWYGLPWNLEHYEQANARLYRQGQTKPVRIYRLIATGTADEHVRDALDKKAMTQGDLLAALNYKG